MAGGSGANEAGDGLGRAAALEALAEREVPQLKCCFGVEVPLSSRQLL